MLLLGQDVLREKQQHIEQLLKERDLERSEITRAANQADEAEQQLATLTLEYDQVSKICVQCDSLISFQNLVLFLIFSISENAKINYKNTFCYYHNLKTERLIWKLY